MSGRTPQQLQRAAQAGGRAPSGRPAPDPRLSVLRLQRSAGNRAAAGLVVAAREQQLQRFGLNDVKDAYKHFKEWRERDHPTEKDYEDWQENSEDVSLHAKQMLDAAKTVYERAAEEAMRRGNSEALAAAHESAEKIEKTTKLLESGEKVFKYGVKTVEVIDELQKMYDAAVILEDADLGNPATQQQAANAADELFGGFGKLGSMLLPETPAKGYFDFLAAFAKYNFFGHWAEFTHSYTDRIMHAADEN